jgi:hypothetical protein
MAFACRSLVAVVAILGIGFAPPSLAAKLQQVKGSAGTLARKIEHWKLEHGELLPLDRVAHGELDDGDASHPSDDSKLDAWSVTAKAGELLTVRMTAGFRSFLFVTRADAPLDVLDVASASKSGEPIALSFELPADGEYLVVANSADPSKRGAYTLEARLEPALAFGGAPDPAGRFAVVAGIDDYVGLVEDLEGPSVDVDLMRRALVAGFGFRDEDVVRLENKRVTRRNLIAAIQNHLGRAGPDGVALLYYSGHGLKLEENLPPLDEETDGVDEALYLADGELLIDDEVNALTAALPASRMLVIFDSCYSGGSNKGPKGRAQAKGLKLQEVSTFLRKSPDAWSVPHQATQASGGASDPASDFVAPAAGHLFVGAASADQLSWTLPLWAEASGRPASVFTVYLWQGLSGDTTRSFEALVHDVARRTSEKVRRDVVDQRAKQGQTPIWIGAAAQRPVSELLGRSEPAGGQPLTSQ